MTSLLWSKLISTLGVITAVSISALSQAPSQATAFHTTAGIYSGTSPAYKDHPDLTCAQSASVNTLMCVSGQSVDLYTKSGALISSTRVSQWMKNNLPGVTASTIEDPRIVFDPFIGTSGRYVFVCSCGYITGGTSAFPIVGISDTDNPEGTWKAAQIGTSEYGDLTMIPGFDKNGLYIMYVQRTTSYANSVVAVWSNKSLGTSIPAPLQTFNSANGSPTYQVHPALDFNPNKAQTSPMYLISGCAPPNNAGNCQNLAHQITLTLNILTWNSAGTAVTLTKSTISTPDYYYGREAPSTQPGGKQLRMQESHYVGVSVEAPNGELFASQPTAMQGSGGAGVADTNGFFAYELNPPSTLVQRFKVGGTSFNAVFPSVTTDGNNTAVWTYFQLSPTQYVAPAIVFLQNNATTLAGPYLLNPSAAIASYSGACPTTNPPGMMGNYSSIQRDPSNPNYLWVYGVYGGLGTTCKWTTEAIKFSVP